MSDDFDLYREPRDPVNTVAKLMRWAGVSDTTAALVEALVKRDAAGRAKYGTTLDRTDLSHADWLQHAAEEALDMAGYLLAAKRELPHIVAQRDEWAKQYEALRKDHDDKQELFLGIVDGMFGLLKAVGTFCDLDGLQYNGKPAREVIVNVLGAVTWTEVRDALQGLPK